jgi:hypothetical protein
MLITSILKVESILVPVKTDLLVPVQAPNNVNAPLLERRNSSYRYLFRQPKYEFAIVE